MTQALLDNDDCKAPAVEAYSRSGDLLTRHLTTRLGDVVSSIETDLSDSSGLPSQQFYDSWLRRKTRPENTSRQVSIVDLFAGCGGLSVGAEEAARAVGLRANHILAVDNNAAALEVYGSNFPEATLHTDGIEELVDGDVHSTLTARERHLASSFDGLDLLIGGPPCQGHSDLNNHSRRSDPRNALYLRLVRFAEVTRPRFVVVENVPGVAHDLSGVVSSAQRALESVGYAVDTGLLTATHLGAAQARRRHVMLASRVSEVVPSVSSVVDMFGSEAGTVMDAIGDVGTEPHRGAFGTPANHNPTNNARIKYLFEHNVFELPNEERPDCHRLKPHSYTSVYGRMYPDRPAPTITSGFGSTGQGRFVHPHAPRTLTPHEAARLQGFPDWFSFDAVQGRRALQEMIGNAVPSRLAYAAIASLLR